MNSIIEKELKRVKEVNLVFNKNTSNLFIPKTNINNYNLKIGEVYKIELDESLLVPEKNSLLLSNWNSGRYPRNKYYQAEILEIIQKMIKINGIAIIDGELEYSENFYG